MVEVCSLKGEGFIPFWVQVPVYDSTPVLETTTPEFDIGVTAACKVTDMMEIQGV